MVKSGGEAVVEWILKGCIAACKGAMCLMSG